MMECGNCGKMTLVEARVVNIDGVVLDFGTYCTDRDCNQFCPETR